MTTMGLDGFASLSVAFTVEIASCGSGPDDLCGDFNFRQRLTRKYFGNWSSLSIPVS